MSVDCAPEAAVVVAALPPSPLYTTPAVPLVAPAGKFVAVAEEVVDVMLTRVGFWAPQGWSALHAL